VLLLSISATGTGIGVTEVTDPWEVSVIAVFEPEMLEDTPLSEGALAGQPWIIDPRIRAVVHDSDGPRAQRQDPSQPMQEQHQNGSVCATIGNGRGAERAG
jgi:hypothetical protein